MLIEIQCENISSFDATVGKYVECGERIIVAGEKAGETIECPKCKQTLEIPLPGEAHSTKSASRSEELGGRKSAAPARAKPQLPEQRSGQQRRSQKSRRASQQRRRPAEGEGKPRAAKVGAVNTRRRAANSEPAQRAKPRGDHQTGEKNTAAKSTSAKSTRGTAAKQRERRVVSSGVGGNKSSANPDRRRQRRRKPAAAGSAQRDIMALDFQSEEVSQGLVGDQQERCKKCGNLVENARCVACFYVDSKFEKIHCPLPDIEIQVAGCQRWLQQTMSEGVSVSFIVLAGNFLVGAMALMLGGISALFLTGLGLGSGVGGVLLFLTVAATCFYFGVIYKSRQFMHKPVAQLAWFQKPFWRLMLFFARFNKWQRYDQALQGRRVITVRDRMFGDNDLMEHKDIKSVQVLDIQGTNLTDKGLLHLYDLKHLQCVVLRKTNVSPEAVFRFQQTFPRLWIWF